MTLNLTASAPVLIGCPDRLANTCSSADAAVRKVSEFNGQTDDVSSVFISHLALYKALLLRVQLIR